MGSLAKALVVVVLVLSLAYVVVSMTLISHQVNWYHRSLELKLQMFQHDKENADRIGALEGRADGLQNALNEKDKVTAQLEKDKGVLSEDLNKARTDVGRLQGERDAFEAQYTQLVKDSQVDKQELSNLRADFKVLESDVVGLKQGNLKLQDDAAALENQLALAEKVKAELYRKNQGLEERTGRLEAEVKAYRTVYGMLPETVSPMEAAAPAIRGQVIAVSKDPQVPMVVLGVGRKNGVQAGFSFVVYRGDQLQGKVIVEKVLDDMAAARIDLRFAQQGASISVGDQATTRLGF